MYTKFKQPMSFVAENSISPKRFCCIFILTINLVVCVFQMFGVEFFAGISLILLNELGLIKTSQNVSHIPNRIDWLTCGTKSSSRLKSALWLFQLSFLTLHRQFIHMHIIFSCNDVPVVDIVRCCVVINIDSRQQSTFIWPIAFWICRSFFVVSTP